MPNIIPLSGGNHAELREPQDVSERLRRPFINAMAQVSPEGSASLEAAQELRALKEDDPDYKAKRADLASRINFSAVDLEHLDVANDAAVVAFLKHWTRPEPITPEAVLELPAGDYDALREAVAPLAMRLTVNFRPEKGNPPQSPTEPSSDSATRSEGALQTNSPTSGGPISSSESASA